jgi:surface polysaccharide O-acyltransferase-like enzyme
VLGMLIYVALCFPIEYWLNVHPSNCGESVVRLIAWKSLRLIGNTIVITALYSLANLGIVNQFARNRSQCMLRLSNCCFGVYIYHQFILKYLYYHTALSSLLTPVLLPWVGLWITLVFSLALSGISLQTKIGRNVLG